MQSTTSVRLLLLVGTVTCALATWAYQTWNAMLSTLLPLGGVASWLRPLPNHELWLSIAAGILFLTLSYSVLSTPPRRARSHVVVLILLSLYLAMHVFGLVRILPEWAAQLRTAETLGGIVVDLLLVIVVWVVWSFASRRITSLRCVIVAGMLAFVATNTVGGSGLVLDF